MAVVLTSVRAPSYQGLSTDDKPAEAVEGATFYAVDTGERWTMHSDMWELLPETAMLAYRMTAAMM